MKLPTAQQLRRQDTIIVQQSLGCSFLCCVPCQHADDAWCVQALWSRFQVRPELAAEEPKAGTPSTLAEPGQHRRVVLRTFFCGVGGSRCESQNQDCICRPADCTLTAIVVPQPVASSSCDHALQSSQTAGLLGQGSSLQVGHSASA